MKNQERDAIDFGTQEISKLFNKLFFPTLMGMISLSSVAAVDGIFVGHGIGSDGIAAINICIPLLMFFTGVGLMIGSGCSVVASLHLSKNKPKVARINITQALIFATLITTLPVLLIIIYPVQTARMLGSSAYLLPMVTDYLVWFIPSVIFQMWVSIALFIIRLDGAPKLAMWCSLISAIINVVLDWLFIFPLQWRLMGAGLASTISIGIGGLVAIIYLMFFAKTLRVTALKLSLKSLRLSIRNIGYQCRIGSSSFFGEATLAMLMFLGNLTFMYYTGDKGVSAFGVACYYLPFVFMIGNAIAQSAQPIISYNLGMNQISRVSSMARISFFTAFICGTIVTVVFLSVPEFLVSLFLSLNDPVAQIAIEGFPYFASGFIFFITNIAIIGYYQSLEKAKPATFFALLRGFIFLTLTFLFMPKLFGIKGIWLAMPIAELLTTIVICIYSRFNRSPSA